MNGYIGQAGEAPLKKCSIDVDAMFSAWSVYQELTGSPKT
jgi:hypothetical protein